MLLHPTRTEGPLSMVVRGQGLGEPVLLHEEETDRKREEVRFISSTKDMNLTPSAFRPAPPPARRRTVAKVATWPASAGRRGARLSPGGLPHHVAAQIFIRQVRIRWRQRQGGGTLGLDLLQTRHPVQLPVQQRSGWH